jgi:hypothetical protein
MSETNKRINFCEAYKRPGDPDWYWKIYHYNAADQEIVTDRAKAGFATPETALDAGVEYCDEHNIDAELVFN